MIKSMTGYGKAEATAAGGRIVAEIRSVNHRYGEIYVKLPRPLMAFERKGLSALEHCRFSICRLAGPIMRLCSG